MADQFKNQVVFITGGSAGIGAGLGVEFAGQGAKVVLAARNQTRLEQSVRAVEAVGGEALAIECDVTDRVSLDKAVAETIEHFGRIDVVVANAGFGVSGSLESLETDDYRRQFDLNFFGLLDTIYACLPALKKSKGRLVLISSVMGKFGRPGSSAYASSKFAVTGLADSIYYELLNEGVSVTCIHPGLVQSHFRMVSNDNEFQEDIPDPAPGRFVVPTEIAARDIVRAVYKRKKEATITGHGRILVFLTRHFPGLTRAILTYLTKGRMEKFQSAFRHPGNKE
jgi:NAD(P)-dependent dehydrogenase (short-subunit alcohol dehydrogenase family)